MDNKLISTNGKHAGALVRMTGGKLGKRLGILKRRWKPLVSLLVLAAAALSVFLLMRSGGGSEVVAMPQTLTLSRTSLSQIVSGTGRLHSSSSRTVTTGLSYEVAEIYVSEGDEVKEGQLLALLDTTDIDKSIEETLKSISDAEASDSLSLSQAERKVQDAVTQYSLDETRLNNDISKSNSKLAEANEKRYDAKKEMEDAERELKKAKKERNSAKDNMDDLYRAYERALHADPHDPNYQDNVDEAESDYESASRAYEAADSEERRAQTAYDGAEQAYEQKKTAAETAQDAYENTVYQKDSTLRQNRISIQNAQDGVDTQKLKDSAASYSTQLEKQLEEKEKCRILAPISGTVTAIYAEVGQGASPSSALFTIEDTTRLEITSSIPEYDAIIIGLAMPVIIASDAISGIEWQGSVKSISQTATDDNSNFTVVIELTSPVGGLRIGMSAKFNIVTESKDNVFAVPYDAVTTNEDGESVIYEHVSLADTAPEGFALEQGGFAVSNRGGGSAAGFTRREIAVSTGMETDYYIEIASSGLSEGMTILADPEGKNVRTGGAGIGFPGFN